MTSKQKVLLGLAGLTALAVGAGSVGTMAWFYSNTTVTASGLSMSVNGPSDNLVVSTDNGNTWVSSFTLTQTASISPAVVFTSDRKRCFRRESSNFANFNADWSTSSDVFEYYPSSSFYDEHFGLYESLEFAVPNKVNLSGAAVTSSGGNDVPLSLNDYYGDYSSVVGSDTSKAYKTIPAADIDDYAFVNRHKVKYTGTSIIDGSSEMSYGSDYAFLKMRIVLPSTVSSEMLTNVGIIVSFDGLPFETTGKKTFFYFNIAEQAACESLTSYNLTSFDVGLGQSAGYDRQHGIAALIGASTEDSDLVFPIPVKVGTPIDVEIYSFFIGDDSAMTNSEIVSTPFSFGIQYDVCTSTPAVGRDYVHIWSKALSNAFK